MVQDFNCLPQQILITILKAYGLAEEAVKLLESYLGDMSQQIKLGTFTRTCVFSGVHLGFILGPLLFNIFINDLFYFIIQCVLYEVNFRRKKAIF